MPDPVPASRVAAVRRFNRFYTRQIGVLNEGLLHSPYSLTEVRVLYELAHRERPTAAELGKVLGLDTGYLSRILRGFQKHRLVSRASSTADRRQSLLSLTDAGRKAFAALDDRSGQEVAAMLRSLTDGEQDQLLGSMGAIERLLGAEARVW